MCEKANELISKQEIAAQSHYGMLEAFMIKSILMKFCWIKTMFSDRRCRKSTSKKKNSSKSSVHDINSTVKLRKSHRKMNYTRQNENARQLS